MRAALRTPARAYTWSMRLLALVLVFLLGQLAFDTAFTRLWPHVYPLLGLTDLTNQQHPWIILYANHAWEVIIALLVIVAFGGRGWREWGGLVLKQPPLSLRLVRGFTLFAILSMLALHITLRLLGTPFPLAVKLTPLDITAHLLFELVVSGVSEDIWFRGMDQSILGANWTGVLRMGKLELPVAGMLAALVFGIGHLPFTIAPPWASPNLANPFTLLNAFVAFLLGLYYAWTRRRTGDIWAAAAAHGIFNFVSAAVMIALAMAG
jgi:membrane protease YdiL (CAAX protease family)